METQRKNVVIFSCFFTPYVSGAERFVLEIAGRLAPYYEITVVTSLFKRSHSKEEMFEGADGSSYRVVRVGIGSWFLDRLLYVIWAPLAARKLKPEILHAVMESYAGGALFNSRWIIGEEPLRILTLQSGEQDSLRKRLKVPWPLRSLIYKTPHVTTAISSYLKERAERYGSKRVVVIPNGVEVKYIQDVGSQVKKVHHRIVCVARLSWEKGHKYLIEAFRIVSQKYSDSRLILVGEGSSEKELKELASAEGIFRKVHFLGALPHSEVIKEMARAEVFVCSSLYEGLGIVFIEAQAAGTPVIGTDVGGIPDVIEDGVTGLLVPSKDSDRLADAIMKIFKEPNKAEDFAREAKARLEKFGWERISGEISQIYEMRI